MHFIFLYPYFFISPSIFYTILFLLPPIFLPISQLFYIFFEEGINEFTFSQFRVSN